MRGKDQQQLTDEELMIAYQNADSAAFEALYQRYAGRVFGYFMSRTRDRQKTGELHQEAFFKLHRSRGSYNPKYAFSSWLFTICHSVLLDHFKSRQNRESQELEALPDSDVPTVQQEALSIPLEGLADDEQKLLQMRYSDELSFKEMAETLQISESSVRQRLSRVVRKLRALLNPEKARLS